MAHREERQLLQRLRDLLTGRGGVGPPGHGLLCVFHIYICIMPLYKDPMEEPVRAWLPPGCGRRGAPPQRKIPVWPRE
ncbi:hypothetical protein Shyhy02_51890 [Streptomyces hygroscopicus subsp. hygroscopicus]|nr:hypothetical protein Shyhy02_51890 [Streptomyces hygroscopicus subsp. hygroscopicus]